MRIGRIFAIVTYGYGAFALLFLAVLWIGTFPALNRFVTWLLWEYNPNPQVWITIWGTVALILVVYGFISAIFFMAESARLIIRKIGERKRGIQVRV